VDKDLFTQLINKQEYWTELPKKRFRFLSKMCSVNSRSFLGTAELLAQCDAFLGDRQTSLLQCYIGTGGTPVDRFLRTIAIEGHDVETLSKIILNTLNYLEIPVFSYRRQC
jgi:hypothetical protein